MPLSPLETDGQLAVYVDEIRKKLLSEGVLAEFESRYANLAELKVLLEQQQSDLTDFLNTGLQASALRVSAVAGVTCTTGTGRSVDFDTVASDSTGGDAEWDGGTPDRVTLNAEGLWVITAGVAWAAIATGIRNGALRLNGTTVVTGDGPHAGHATVTPTNNFSWPHIATAGDFFEVRAFQDSGSNKTATGFLHAVYFGAAG